ncbi:MAG: ABC transporter ATP-binding protein [Myxococcota bacterium]
MAALELAGVSKRYGSRAALQGVDLRVEAGQTLGLLGPNGAGKTTALRLLLGFARPSEGRVTLRGGDPARAASRRGVAYLPERLRLPARMGVRALLRLHGQLAGLEGAELMRAIDEVLERTGLSDRGDDRIGGLSKGLAQRVGFAQALLGRPEVLLLDEPTSGLDPIGIRDARDWIHHARTQGATVLVSSHVLSEVERVCDHAAILHEGRIASQGAIEELVGDGESLEDAFVRAVRG